MHIHLEAPDTHAIRSYSEEGVTINQVLYKTSVIISQHIVSPWSIHSIQELDPSNLEPILALEPELIIIGHQQSGIYIPVTTMEYLSKRRIGIESMSIGAASRTFNVLLSEQRLVVAGIIL